MTLRFHKKIYPKATINKAIKAFEELVSASVNRDGDYFVVDLVAQDDGDPIELAGEFRNFVLGTAISLRGE